MPSAEIGGSRPEEIKREIAEQIAALNKMLENPPIDIEEARKINHKITELQSELND